MKKTILLTGATGFLGSHILASLREIADVIVLKRSFSDVWRIRQLLSGVTHYDTDKTPLENIFQEHRIDGIVHVATEYGRKKEAEEIVASNVVFPLKLLRLGVSHKVPFFINTDTFYNKGAFVYSYLSHYSLSKKQFVAWLKLFQGQGTRILSLKLAHFYGPKDGPEKFVPQMLSRMLRHEAKIELTGGKQRRDFIYVDDVVRAYRMLVEKIEEIREPYLELDVGTGRSASVKDFLQVMRRLTRSRSTLEFGKLPYRKDEIMEHHSRTSGLVRILGWKPETCIEDGLTKLIASEQAAL